MNYCGQFSEQLLLIIACFCFDSVAEENVRKIDDNKKKLIFSLCRYASVKTSVNIIGLTDYQRTNQSGARIVRKTLSPTDTNFKMAASAKRDQEF